MLLVPGSGVALCGTQGERARRGVDSAAPQHTLGLMAQAYRQHTLSVTLIHTLGSSVPCSWSALPSDEPDAARRAGGPGGAR